MLSLTPAPLPPPTPPQSRQQKRAKRLEDLQAGKQKPLVEDPSQLDEELSKWVVWNVWRCVGGRLQAGKQKPLVEDPSQLDEELSKWVVWGSVGDRRMGRRPASRNRLWRAHLEECVVPVISCPEFHTHSL